MSSKTMSMKLVIGRKTKRVLFAEASKDVVDFIFSLLAVPLGNVTKLLKKENMPGSIGSVYKSIEELDINYFQSNDQNKKNILLNPSITVSPVKYNNLLFASNTAGLPGKYYQCTDCRNNYFTDVYKGKCTSCGDLKMSKEIMFTSAPSTAGDGLVKRMVVYTVLDDLSVIPMSSVSNMKMLEKLNIKDLGELEEYTINIGVEEGLKILKASLQLKTVLTDVFVRLEVKSKGS